MKAPPNADLVAAAQAAVAAWAPLAGHPNLGPPVRAFVSADAGGAPALWFAHDLLPGASTLEQAHLQPLPTPTGLVRNSASEEQLWSYLVLAGG